MKRDVIKGDNKIEIRCIDMGKQIYVKSLASQLNLYNYYNLVEGKITKIWRMYRYIPYFTYSK